MHIFFLIKFSANFPAGKKPPNNKKQTKKQVGVCIVMQNHV